MINKKYTSRHVHFFWPFLLRPSSLHYKSFSTNQIKLYLLNHSVLLCSDLCIFDHVFVALNFNSKKPVSSTATNTLCSHSLSSVDFVSLRSISVQFGAME